MHVTSLQTASMLHRLPGAGSAETPAPVNAQQKVAGQFEGVFTSMLLKQLRESLDNGIFGEENSDTYGAMFDLYLGEHIAQQGGLGLRDLILTQISPPQQQGTDRDHT